MRSAGKTIFIADSHLGEKEEENLLFFRMLESFRKEPPSALVFLGDIFELWIALPGYETPWQKKFLAYCREAKKDFPIYFVEGNHEFYVSSSCRDAFTKVHAKALSAGENTLVIHGDTINGADWKYASLRVLIRNFVSRFFLRLLAFAWGVEAVNWIRLTLKPTNKAFKSRFPKEAFAARLQTLAAKKKGIRTLFTGHFHSGNHLESSGITVHTIPAWDKENALIGVWDAEKNSLAVLPFREVGQGE